MRLGLQREYQVVDHTLLRPQVGLREQKFNVQGHQITFEDHLEYFYNGLKRKLSLV